MRFGSVCSGIEAASVAWEPLGWRAAFVSEIEPFPCAVLAHHYPDAPNLGDMTKFQGWPDANLDVLCGGTPCQSFSVAGLRKGLDDPRGNLMLTFGAIAAKHRPRWLVWENVPGVLSSNKGRDFGSFLGLLGFLGYGFAYRVLDAQYSGLAQRRKRVFVIACLGDWRSAAAVLFEFHSLQGHPAPSRQAGETVTGTLSARTSGGGGLGTDFELSGGLIAPRLARCVATREGSSRDFESTKMVVQKTAPAPAIAFQSSQSGMRCGETHATLDANNGSRRHNGVLIGMRVRRLTPRECARLQGFPDDYLDIIYRGKPASDGPKYKALGNSWAVPVVRWIGERIQAVDAIHCSTEAAARPVAAS